SLCITSPPSSSTQSPPPHLSIHSHSLIISSHSLSFPQLSLFRSPSPSLSLDLYISLRLMSPAHSSHSGREMQRSQSPHTTTAAAAIAARSPSLCLSPLFFFDTVLTTEGSIYCFTL